MLPTERQWMRQSPQNAIQPKSYSTKSWMRDMHALASNATKNSTQQLPHSNHRTYPKPPSLTPPHSNKPSLPFNSPPDHPPDSTPNLTSWSWSIHRIKNNSWVNIVWGGMGIGWEIQIVRLCFWVMGKLDGTEEGSWSFWGEIWIVTVMGVMQQLQTKEMRQPLNEQTKHHERDVHYHPTLFSNYDSSSSSFQVDILSLSSCLNHYPSSFDLECLSYLCSWEFSIHSKRHQLQRTDYPNGFLQYYQPTYNYYPHSPPPKHGLKRIQC